MAARLIHASTASASDPDRAPAPPRAARALRRQNGGHHCDNHDRRQHGEDRRPIDIVGKSDGAGAGNHEADAIARLSDRGARALLLVA
jgi:hypothetical protein